MRLRSGATVRLYGVVDQFLFSVSNLLMSALTARDTTPAEFGAFALAYSVFLIIQTVNRGGVSNVCAIVLPSVGSPAAGAVQTARALSAALITGMIGSAALVLLITVSDTSAITYLLLFAAVTPPIMVQDAARYVAFSTYRPGDALTLDAAWVAVQLVAEGGYVTLHSDGGSSHTVAWACGGLASCGLAISRGYRPGWWAGAKRWAAEHRSQVTSQLAETVAIVSIAQGVPLLVGAIAGRVALGQLRIAQTVFGPVTSLNAALVLAVTPIATRLWNTTLNKAYLRPLVMNCLAVCAVTAVVGATIEMLPDHVGRLLLGSNWQSANDLALVTSLWLGLGYIGAVAGIALRICGSPGSVARARLLSILPSVAIAGFWASWDGAYGATIGLALTTAVTSLVLVGVLRRRLAGLSDERYLATSGLGGRHRKS